MSDMHPAEITLRVPGESACALILRTTLGGVAILKDLTVDQMDDLRTAADEACDCLLHQGRSVAALVMRVNGDDRSLTVTISAEFAQGDLPGHDHHGDEVSRAVLETLIPVVELEKAACGCISAIGLTLPLRA